MKQLKHILIILTGLSVLLSFTACEDEGPAEKAGEKIDKMVEQSKESLEKAGDTMQEKAEEAGEKIEEGMKKTGEKIEEAGEQLQK